MSHLFTNRPKHFDLTVVNPTLIDHFWWETLNAILYNLGGAMFIAGSIMFFPRFQAYEDVGAWLFFFGSLLYLIVIVHDIMEVRKYWKTEDQSFRGARLEYVAGASHLIGTLLFTVGSLFFVSWWGWYTLGVWCFVIGSVLFAVGAGVNALRIVGVRNAPSLITIRLFNLTAVTFVIGSILFVVASIPYLWTIENDSDRNTLFAFLAWQYLVGSELFFLGGIVNYCRAFIVMRDLRLGRMVFSPEENAMSN